MPGRKGCPRTDELLRAADEAQVKQRVLREFGEEGGGAPVGMRQGDVVHVLRNDMLPLTKEAPKFDFTGLFDELPPRPVRRSQVGTVQESIDESRKLLIDVAQAHHNKLAASTSARAVPELPEVTRPKTPDAVRQMGRGEEYYTPRKKKRRQKEDTQTTPIEVTLTPHEPFTERKSSKGVTRKLHQFVNISYRRVQRCKFGAAKDPEDTGDSSPFRAKAVLTPRADLDKVSLQQYSFESIRARTKDEKKKKLASSVNVFKLTQPTEGDGAPETALEEKKGSFLSHELAALTTDLKEAEGAEIDVEGTRECEHSKGGHYSLVYKKVAVKDTAEPRESMSYKSFKQGLDNRASLLNSRCMAELERCDQRRRIFFADKYEVLGELSESKHAKHSSWHPAAEELHRVILNLAVMKDTKEKLARRRVFLKMVRRVVDDSYSHVRDCYVLLEKLENFMGSEGAVIDQKSFLTLVSTFPTSRLLQDGLRQVLDVIRPIFNVPDERWIVFLNERFSSFQATNIDLLLDTHAEKQLTPPSATPLRISIKVHTVRGIDRPSCLAMVSLKAEGIWSKPKEYPFSETELCGDFKTGVRRGPKPVWNEEATMGFERFSAMEILLYDLSEVDGGPLAQSVLNLDHHGQKLTKTAKVKVTLPLKPRSPRPSPPEAIQQQQLGSFRRTAISAHPPAAPEIVISLEALNFGPGQRGNVMRSKEKQQG
eukprot:TRINITY_DN19426_c0_g1_i1.p1 TRINITY_DN19426_c0_g1~~TRINITY_DN19426_c0_g1_i1.p1  ORF type:complete len:735 (+),score=70.39 TRINITY_DN19426_c0_g1_i1:77-2206(+)